MEYENCRYWIHSSPGFHNGLLLGRVLYMKSQSFSSFINQDRWGSFSKENVKKMA
jgi:hypothetical protein